MVKPKNMKMPKGFNKMTLLEQETCLVKEMQRFYLIEMEYRKLLAKIRGGQRIVINEIDRPDELLLKA